MRSIGAVVHKPAASRSWHLGARSDCMICHPIRNTCARCGHQRHLKRECGQAVYVPQEMTSGEPYTATCYCTDDVE